jgi:hypothetical protein
MVAAHSGALAAEAAGRTAKPLAILANLASAVDPQEAALARATGVPVLEGTATGLAALAHLLTAATPPRQGRSRTRPRPARRTRSGNAGAPASPRPATSRSWTGSRCWPTTASP